MHRRATITFLLQSFGKNWYSGPHIYERQSAGDSEWWKTRTKVLEISYNNPVRKFRITYLKKSKPNWDLSGEKTKKGENITPNLGLPPPPARPPQSNPSQITPNAIWAEMRLLSDTGVAHRSSFYFLILCFAKPFFVRPSPYTNIKTLSFGPRHLFAHVIAPLAWEFPNSEFPAALSK